MSESKDQLFWESLWVNLNDVSVLIFDLAEDLDFELFGDHLAVGDLWLCSVELEDFLLQLLCYFLRVIKVKTGSPAGCLWVEIELLHRLLLCCCRAVLFRSVGMVRGSRDLISG